ncbi:hypothetical protein HDK64DRAFT_334507 [Phyllosticta capitalensis]
MDSPNRRLDSKMFQLAPSPIQSAKLKMAVDSSYSDFVQSADDAIRLIALTGSVEDKRQKRPWKNVEQATRSSTPKRLNSSIHDPRSQHRSIAVLVVSFAASSTCDFALANGKAQHDLQRPQDAGQTLFGRTLKPWNAAQSAGEQSGEIAVRKLLETDSSHVIRLVAWKKADFGCRVCAGFIFIIIDLSTHSILKQPQRLSSTSNHYINMDALKDKLSGHGSGDKTQTSNTAGGSSQNEDYLDKGLDSFEKKKGLPVNRDTNEKITDAARGAFEKVTGKDVPDKISN